MKYLLALVMILMPFSVLAHTSSYTVFDFEPKDDGSLELVVGLQPEMALLLLGHQHDEDFSFETFEEQSDLIAAFVQDHVTIKQRELDCEWDAEPEAWPENEILLRAEGITVRGHITCPKAISILTVGTDLFYEAHLEHRNVLRLYQDGIVRELDQLDRDHQEAEIDFRLIAFLDQETDRKDFATTRVVTQSKDAPSWKGVAIISLITIFLLGFSLYQKRRMSPKIPPES